MMWRACASMEFWTSSATALRGSDCERASQRMRSNGSAGRSTNVRADAFGTGGSVSPHGQPSPERQGSSIRACTPSGTMSDPRATFPPMQSEQTRRRKREQRRRKREEKRQALRSGTPLGGIPVPRTAISDVLLEYVGPLVQRLSLAARPEQLRTVLQLAVIVWNAMLDTSGEPEDKARRMIARMQSKFWTPPPTVVIDWLARRRILRYGHDRRLIASADVARES